MVSAMIFSLGDFVRRLPLEHTHPWGWRHLTPSRDLFGQKLPGLRLEAFQGCCEAFPLIRCGSCQGRGE